MLPDRSGRTRILQVINTSEDGGGARHLQALVSRLDPQGYFPVVATTDHGPLVGRLQASQVEVVDVDMMRSRVDPRPVARLRGLLRGGDFGILHLHGTRAGFFGALAAAGLPAPPRIVYTVHGLSCSRRAPAPVRRVFAAVERFIAARADRVISVSERDRILGVEQGILPPGRTLSIPNGIDLAALEGPIPAPMSRPGGLRVVTVARLVPQKGIPVLLEAAARVVRARPEIRFTILGDGPDRAALHRRAERLGLDGVVRFGGSVPEALSALPLYDVFVLPSLWEGMPISLLEAMAAGRVVIATAVSGSAELVLDGETGRLVPPGDPKALAAAILQAASQPERHVAMAARARDRARREFSVERMVQSTIEVYRGLLS